MSTYEIRLVCPFCGASTVLGTVDAPTPCDARHQAADLWPNARYEEMVPYIKQGYPCHENREQVYLLNDQIMQGLLTPQEATLIMSGRTV